MAVSLERSAQRKVQAKSGRVGVKARDLVPKYCTQEKVAKLIEKMRGQGLWSWDEDWPDDEEDCKRQNIFSNY